MTGVAIEDLLELWSAELRKAKLSWLIDHPSVRRRLSWTRCLDRSDGVDARGGRPRPLAPAGGTGAQPLGCRRAARRDYALETLAEGDAVLVIDETGFLKQGKASCGVGRQYTGSAGKITNCQVGVFAAYVSTRGHALISSTCPRTGPVIRSVWRRCPRSFATKPHLAVEMVERAIGAGVPFAWVAADSVMGRRGRDGVAPGGQGICARRREQFNSWDKPEPVSGTAEAIALALPASRWVRLPAGAGTRAAALRLGLCRPGRPRRAEFLRVLLGADDLDTADPAERRENGLRGGVQRALR